MGGFVDWQRFEASISKGIYIRMLGPEAVFWSDQSSRCLPAVFQYTCDEAM